MNLKEAFRYQNIFRAVKKTMLRRLGKNEEAELVR